MSAVVTHGLSVVVLRDRFETRFPPSDAEREAWLQRTDYAWVCSADACKNVAGVMYKTLAGAKRSAEKHAGEHQDATVVEATPQSAYPPGLLEALVATMPPGAVEDWGG